jgi:perosamine synthetase
VNLPRIPQIKPFFNRLETEAAISVVESAWITEGSCTTEFASQLNKLMGVEYGVFAPNGTLALVLGLLALDIGPGDEVLVPDITFVASAASVCLVGATPVFVGVNEHNYQIDVSRCGEKLTPCTKVIMPVHLYGMSAGMNDVLDFAGQNDLLIIEDAAQAIGVYYDTQHCGTFGDIGCFSFFADKTITTGEGGYVICKDLDVYHHLLTLRNQGRHERGSYVHPEIGYNFRITDLQAALGLVQLSKLDDIRKRKSRILGWYQKFLGKVDQVRFIPIESSSTYVPFRIVLLCDDVQGLMIHLDECNIETRPFFTPLHRQPCFEYMELEDTDFPNAVAGWEHGICLPVYPSLNKNEVNYICTCIEGYYS